MKCQKCKKRISVAIVGKKRRLLCADCKHAEDRRNLYLLKYLVTRDILAVYLSYEHEWHADQENQCNFCVRCYAGHGIYTTQEIYVL